MYHHTPCDGLADPQVPGLELSPAAMFDHGVARAGYIEVPRDPDLAYEFLKTEWVPVHHYGVELRSCRYRGPALAGLAGQTSPYTGPRARGRWPVQADPDDITRVYFRRPDSRRWSVLTWEHAPTVDFPVSEEALELARKMAASKSRYPDDKQAVAELLERWNLGLGLTAAERRMALRLSREQKALLDARKRGRRPAGRAAVAEPGSRPAGSGPGRRRGRTGRDEPQPYSGQAEGDDDEEDELGGLAAPDGGEDDFYADALGDA